MSSSIVPHRAIVPAISPCPGPLRIAREHPWKGIPQWPANWIHPPSDPAPPWVGFFELRFDLPVPETLRFSVTADERFELWLDDQWLAEGPARGDAMHWYYSTHEVRLDPGAHHLVCRVHALGDLAPLAQHSFRPGLLLAGHDAAQPLLSTGVAEWTWHPDHSRTFFRSALAAPDEHLDTSRLAPLAPLPVIIGAAGNNGSVLYVKKHVPLLAPSLLPPLRRADWTRELRALHVDDAAWNERFPDAPEDSHADVLGPWTDFLAGSGPLKIPASRRTRMLLDAGRQLCGRLRLTFSGGRGSTVHVIWSEAAVFCADTPEADDDLQSAKGQRDAWRGGFFRGHHDQIFADGRIHSPTTLWWRSGRFIVLEFSVADEPLELHRLSLEETGHGPALSPAVTGHAHWDQLAALCVRSLQTCAHETTMDCPHYEQLAYAGDARVQLLCWARLLPEETGLHRHTLRHFQASALNAGGWSASSAPSRTAQTIPPFSLWWITLASDYVQRTGDFDFVRPMMPALRGQLERWLALRDPATGLCVSPGGWNFADAAFPGSGVPPGGRPGEISGLLNWIVLHGLDALALLEQAGDEPLLLARLHELRAALLDALVRHTWDDAAGLFRDAPETAAFSEHSQALALLIPGLAEAQSRPLLRWLADPDHPAPPLVVCQAFFNYYLFAACLRHGVTARIARGLAPWWKLSDQGFTTTPEHFGRTRSDNHAWSAHPLLLALEIAEGKLPELIDAR